MIKLIELCSSIIGRVISHYAIVFIDKLLSSKKTQEQSDSKDSK